MTNELITQAKACKSADELRALAKENNIDMTAEEAAAKYAELHAEGELSDDELDGAAGGGCGSNKDSIAAGDCFTFKSGKTCTQKGCSCAIFRMDGWMFNGIGFKYSCTACEHGYQGADISDAKKC